MHEVNWHKLDRPETPVDPANKLIHHAAQVLVLLDVLTRRDSELYEHDFADPFGVLGEKTFEGVQFLRDPLDVVETVDSDNDFDTFETFLELLETGLDFVGCESLAGGKSTSISSKAFLA